MDLKAYFHEPYQGGESFINNVILPIFGEDKYDDAYEEDVIDNNPELERMAESTGISQILRLGTIDIPMNPTDVFDITVNNRIQMERNRVAIQMLIRRIMSTYSSAFMVFHYNDTNKWDWRFSFCSKQGNNSETTDSKRYTFLLGPNQSCRTAAENFNKLAEKTGKIELDDIVKAFDVEVLSKEFFDKYKHHYECFCEYVYDNKDNTECFGREFSECEDKIIRDYVKKLLGRIVFLHFLQKKGWMGVPADKEWGEGDLNFMRNLFNNASQSQKENFLDKVLKPLFEKGLDTDRTANNDLFDTGVEGFKNVKIPYLNGGLFEKDELDKPKARFSAQLFDDLLEFFYEYNFTIDENDPNDAQVGVDPEMLGRIFENLLEDNKDKGAFYTPKEIVQYMCKESLIAYLQTDVKTEETKKAIRTFVTTYDVNAIGGKDSATAKDIDEYLKDVKICDPAIGSGAFPMGMLKELFFCRGAIENFDDAAEIKRHIIQQNIYGVDIEKGAVDIARLRFWLALIVDEKTPHALPNMDFKIMQGNSLLEQYKGVDLSRIMENKTVSFGAMQIPFLENDIDESRRQLIALRKEYFHTYDKERKKTLRKAMREKVQQLIDLTTNNLGGTYNGKHSETIDLSGIDIASTPDFFLWHTWFCDVFENGGFDIVIGNPPYIDSETMVKIMPIERELYAKKFKIAKGNWDIYIPFYELGISMLDSMGILCYITPNKWVSIGYGEKMRELYFSNFSQVCDCSLIKVFEAGNEPLICFFQAQTQDYVSLWRASSQGFLHIDNISKKKLNEDSLGMLLSDELELLINICKASHTLADFSQSQNPFSTSEAYELCKIVKENVNEKNCLKLINTGTIDPYESLWGVKTTSYLKGKYKAPVISKEAFQKMFPKRVKQTLPKLIITGMRYFEVFYDEQGEYVAGKSTIVIMQNSLPKERILFLLGILNSTLIQFYINEAYSTLGIGGGINFSTNIVDGLPIPEVDKQTEKEIVKFVEDIIKSNHEKIKKLKLILDEKIYKLYNLYNKQIEKIKCTKKKD